MGHSKLHHRIIEARLETTLDGAGDDARYVRGHVSRTGNFPTVKSLENDNDEPFAGLGTADALIVVPAGTARMNAGDTVKVMQLDALSDE
jgi:molybdopterin biosynthesis enzyme